AALFSAISTAFLIQSTGLLQENSADVTAQTLQAISKTLYAIANNSSPPEPIAPTGNETTGFTPSRSSVVVNTLWYLSLGLSIATSFLAMLAKDWCHSFMAHRSGHPYLQARRRQRKWIMIERWKMQELMAALPLLIHIALPLQAIAGANGRLPHQPLEECGASLAILQLLASSSLYKGSRQKANEKRISLYVRALSFLGSQGNSTNTGDLEVMLWDLQAENEKTVSALIADGKFTPEDHNLAALRIGSIAPSQCLQLLKDSNQDSHAFLNLIIPLLEKHADQTQELHPAARLSLVNATILLWACMTSNEVPVAFPGLLMQILYNDVVFWGGDLDLGVRLITCSLLQGQPKYSVPGPSNPMTLHAQKAFQVFLARQSANKDEQRRFISFGTLEILSNASQYNINLHENGAYRRTLEMAQEGTSTMMAELPLPVDRLKAPRSEECVVLPIVESLNQVYTIVPASTPDQGVYMFVVECMLCVDSSPVGTLCWSLMTGFSFPKLCAKLLEYVDSRSLIQVFHRNLDDSYSKTQFFAAAQLWLLCTLYLDSPADVIEVDRAKLILILEQSPLLRDDKLTVDQAKDRMGLRIEELAAEIERPGTHTVYTLRVLECVLQSRGAPPTDPRWERINRELGDVPQALRGLGSFIPLPMRQPLTTIQPENILDGRHISISLEGGGNSSGEP
ncbi:hypothetical protein FRC11_007197, partial [Ceratobasidium sp. 423]